MSETRWVRYVVFELVCERAAIDGDRFIYDLGTKRLTPDERTSDQLQQAAVNKGAELQHVSEIYGLSGQAIREIEQAVIRRLRDKFEGIRTGDIFVYPKFKAMLQKI